MIATLRPDEEEMTLITCVDLDRKSLWAEIWVGQSSTLDVTFTYDTYDRYRAQANLYHTLRDVNPGELLTCKLEKRVLCQLAPLNDAHHRQCHRWSANDRFEVTLLLTAFLQALLHDKKTIKSYLLPKHHASKSSLRSSSSMLVKYSKHRYFSLWEPIHQVGCNKAYKYRVSRITQVKPCPERIWMQVNRISLL